MIDVLFVNPPSPDGDYFIRDTTRVGRRSREGMVWPQTSLAQLAAMVHDKYSVAIADCNAERISWSAFRAYLDEQRPRYLVTHATAPTLTNDMYTTFLGKAIGARTAAVGTHVTPMARETLEAYPSLDYVIRGEPEMIIRELVETLEEGRDIDAIRGVAFRQNGRIVVNADRPLIEDLDTLPLPLHHLLPLDKYRMPMIKGKYTFVLTSRGCPAKCTFCIKHVNYGQTVRVRSPEHIMDELKVLRQLGVHSIHFEADLFTVDREQVIGLCKLILSDGLRIRWTCNSRVDFVDQELLGWMKKAGCWLISWGIESGCEDILRNVRKGTNLAKIERALRWSKEAGIKNWGYFILGLAGETEDTLNQTIRFAKRLPLDIALFHIAVPYPGTPFYHQAKEQGWLKMHRWEELDMDCSTVLSYPHLSAQQLEQAARRAFWQWAMRPGPLLTMVRTFADPGAACGVLRTAVRHLNWARGGLP